MAGVSLFSSEVLLSKRVQERAVNGEEPPHLYICRDGDEDVCSQLTSIPIVDLSVLSPSETRSKQDCELQKLHSALSSWGCFQIMTNGIFKSPVHRVLVNSKRERISVPMFYSPEPNKEIGPEEGLINEETPRLFRNIKNYVATYLEYYQRGQRALDAAKV